MSLYENLKRVLQKNPYLYDRCRSTKNIIKAVFRKMKLSINSTKSNFEIMDAVCLTNYTKSLEFNPINPINCRKTTMGEKRVNVLIPSINPEHVFGGVSTAIRLFERLVKEKNIHGRIIVTQYFPSQEALKNFSKYEFVQATDDSDSKLQIVYAGDRIGCIIPVGQNDIFLATAWWTACNSYELIEWQNYNYGFSHKLIYLIQDFEPGFYAWSMHYVLADSTYKRDYPTLAIFNSKELYDFFDLKRYRFNETAYFEPILNPNLKKAIYKTTVFPKRKKQILLYGRPSTPRNAFELIVAALQKWSEIQPNASEWSIISLGETHPEIQLKNDAKVISLGKLNLQEYAEIMLESYAGISLMVSPHPSYPSLEMSTFGMKVITNNYENKNLNNFNSNIIGLEKYCPDDIALELKKLCDNYNIEIVPKMLENKKYVDGSDEFPFVKELNI